MPGQIGWKSTEITLPVKGFRCRSNSTSRIGCKSTEMIPNLTRQAYNVISVNFHPIWPVIYARSNSTGRIGCKSIEITLPVKGIRPVKLGGNPLRLHCLLKAFDRSNSTGRIGCKSTEMIPNSTRQAYNVISVNFHPIWPVIYAQSNSTGWIGCKSIEITLPVKAFRCPVEFDQSNWVEIHWDYDHQIWPGRHTT